MTDKEKIRAEVYRRFVEAGIHEGVIAETREDELSSLLDFIDSLQEEPVSKPIDFEKELYKAFGQVKDFTLGMRIAKWFYDMGKKSREPVSEDLEEAAMSYGKSIVQLACDELSREFGGEYTPGEDNILLVAKYFKAGANWQKERMVQQLEDIVYRRYSDDGDTNQRNKDLIKLIQNWKG